jgi:hypothetical protein
MSPKRALSILAIIAGQATVALPEAMRIRFYPSDRRIAANEPFLRTLLAHKLVAIS